MKQAWNSSLFWAVSISLCAIVTADSADSASVASSMLHNFDSLSKLIVASAFILSLGFCMAAILKFKHHFDNPTKSNISTPIALLLIAAALFFFSFILTS